MNDEIRKTLASDHKARFVLMNNGVTIIARTIHPTGNRFYIENFQIVNGCQTSHILADQKGHIDESVMTYCLSTNTNETRTATRARREGQSKGHPLPLWRHFAGDSEVRPWIGAYVSVSLFEIFYEIKTVDRFKFHDREPLFLEKPLDHVYSSQEVEEAVWRHIDRAFSQPVTESDNSPDYVPTQILAELFKLRWCFIQEYANR